MKICTKCGCKEEDHSVIINKPINIGITQITRQYYMAFNQCVNHEDCVDPEYQEALTYHVQQSIKK